MNDEAMRRQLMNLDVDGGDGTIHQQNLPPDVAELILQALDGRDWVRRERPQRKAVDG